MNKILYSKMLLSAKKTVDGESAVRLIVTEETNGYAVFVTGSYSAGTELLKWFYSCDRDDALEWAIKEGPSYERVKVILEVDTMPAKSV